MPKCERFRTARPVAALQRGRGDWYKISNNTGAGVATIHVYDEIGYFGVTASDFIAELRAIDARSIDLHISSPGGEVFDGFAIFEALRAHRATVTTYVDSLAASIASVIAMAGDRIVMGRFAELMIHDAMGLCVGNADDMAAVIADLDRESERIAAVYADRAGGTATQWRKAMKAETWYSAQEAVDAGLADEIATPARPDQDDDDDDVAARWDLSIFRYQNRGAAPAPVPAPAPAPEPVAPDGPGPAPAAAVKPAPEPEPLPLVAFDPSVFRAATTAASDPMPDYDPEHLRSLMAAVRDDAPAVPEPARPDEPYVPRPAPTAPEPAPEPIASAEPGFDPDRFRDLMTGVAHDAPAPAAPARPAAPYVPRPAEQVPEPPLPGAEVMANYFRAVLGNLANDAPAPPAPSAPEPPVPEPIPAIDQQMFERSLREARL